MPALLVLPGSRFIGLAAHDSISADGRADVGKLANLGMAPSKAAHPFPRGRLPPRRAMLRVGQMESCERLQVGPHHTAYPAHPSVLQEVIHRAQAPSPAVAQRFDRHVEADLVAVLETVGDRLRGSVDVHLGRAAQTGSAGRRPALQDREDGGLPVPPRAATRVPLCFVSCLASLFSYSLSFPFLSVLVNNYRRLRKKLP